MRRLLFWATMMIATLALQNGWGKTPDCANPARILAFSTLLRKLDLNTKTHDGFAITKAEYEQLGEAWQALSRLEKNQLLGGPAGRWWKNTCAMALIYDLNNREKWEVHIEHLTDLGSQGLSLTASLLNNPVRLEKARSMLVDLLYTGPAMVSDGRLEIADEINVQAAARAGDRARHRLEGWERLINNYQNRTSLDKLKAVNTYFNETIQPRNDQGSTKRYDYWQSPIETLVRGIGDCDDFAMAKYVSLRLLGIPVEQLRLASFKARPHGHLVLLFYPHNHEPPLVLDCLAFVHLGYRDHHILPLARWRNVHRMKRLYEINETDVRLFDEQCRLKRTYNDPKTRLPRFGRALINSRRVLPKAG